MQGSTIAPEQFDARRNEYDIAAANVAGGASGGQGSGAQS